MLRGEEKECSWPHWKHENVQWAMNESKVHRKLMQGAPDDKERVLAGSRQALVGWKIKGPCKLVCRWTRSCCLAFTTRTPPTHLLKLIYLLWSSNISRTQSSQLSIMCDTTHLNETGFGAGLSHPITPPATCGGDALVSTLGTTTRDASPIPPGPLRAT